MKTKKITLLGFSFLFITFAWSQEYKRMIEDGSYSVYEIQKEAEAYFDTHDTGKGSGYKQYKRWEYNALLMMDEKGLLTPDEVYFKELEAYNKYRNQRKSKALNDNWEELGPTYYNATAGWNPGVGRLTSLAVDKSNTDHIIVGSNWGGVWKTTDEGENWTPLSDNHNGMKVYALTIDQSNTDTYYWGANGGTIYKSTDGGGTWNPIGRAGRGTVNKILIHPGNNNVLFATSESDGIYKSTNAGENWSRVVDGDRMHDIEFKPGDANIVYASGKRVFKSTNGGDSFSAIGNNFGDGVKMIGVTPANPDKLYIIEEREGKFNGFYVSNNNGDSFDKKNHSGKNYFGYSVTADDNSGQAPRDMDIAVSASDENEVHIAGILSWLSVDGGNSFRITSDWTPGGARRENIGYCHADIDILEMADNRLYVGSDGGIFVADKTRDVSTEYYRDLTFGMGVRAFYRLGVSQTDPVVITAGSQDNGTSTYTESRGWTDWLGADGMEGFVAKDNTEIIYGTTQGGGLSRSLNQGRSLRGDIDNPDDKSGNWVTPFEKDPIDGNVIYSGYDQVYKSNDGGENWFAISQEFDRNLDHLKIAPSNNNTLYCAFRDRLFVETDGDGNWTERVDTGFSGRINSIAIHPRDPDKIAIATTDRNTKVFISNDRGRTWESYRKNLPNFSANCLVWQDNDSNGLYLGMNYGIYYIDDNLEEWENFSNNLPNIRVDELEINYADGRIYAATHGRGIWSSPIFESNTLSVDTQKMEAAISTFPNPADKLLNIQWNKGVDVALRIFNIQGRLIHYKRDVSLQEGYTVDVSGYAPGTYFMRINSKQGVFTKKIVVE